MTDTFTEDSTIQQIAEAYAADAVDFARDNFKIALDWSDGSVVHIETMIDAFHRDLARANPSEEQVFGFAKMFGSYVGEVFRRNHGATWGMVNLNRQVFPGLKAGNSSGLFWPWGRAQNRIMNGPDENIWHYYQVLLERHGGGSPEPAANKGDPKKSFWARLRGA